MQREDKFNKELEKAELSAQRAENLIKHESEILSRPAKKWIMSNKQKKLLNGMCSITITHYSFLEKEKDALGIDKTGKKRVREEASKPNKRKRMDEPTRKHNLRDRDQKVLEDAGIKDLKSYVCYDLHI